MKLLLDSSAYIELQGGNERAAGLVRAADEIYVNPVFLGEIRSGLIRGAHSGRRLAFLEKFLSSDRVIVVAIDQTTAEVYAELVLFLKEAGSPIPTNDIWIAASAVQYGLKVLTTDRHFLKMPQVMKEVFEIE